MSDANDDDNDDDDDYENGKLKIGRMRVKLCQWNSAVHLVHVLCVLLYCNLCVYAFVCV